MFVFACWLVSSAAVAAVALEPGDEMVVLGGDTYAIHEMTTTPESYQTGSWSGQSKANCESSYTNGIDTAPRYYGATGGRACRCVNTESADGTTAEWVVPPEVTQ